MFNIFKKKPQGETIAFKISGMHCTSCGLNIDGDLEDLPGVIEATTSYAKSKSEVVFDPIKVNVADIKKVITDLGYEVEVAG